MNKVYRHLFFSGYMPHTIAIFPKFVGLDKVNSIMKKYNPSCNNLKPHIALVYYFDKKPAKREINELMKSFSSFEIRLNSLTASTS